MTLLPNTQLIQDVQLIVTLSVTLNGYKQQIADIEASKKMVSRMLLAITQKTEARIKYLLDKYPDNCVKIIEEIVDQEIQASKFAQLYSKNININFKEGVKYLEKHKNVRCQIEANLLKLTQLIEKGETK